uniref:Putative secreted protein n=1 Tax=Amblyomma cajennense TaxID=34607 RepID=A0A023FCX7_AMBCJ
MEFVAIAILLVLSFNCCVAYQKPPCDANFIARRLGYNPDAWQLITEEHPRYRLMFHSNGSLQVDYRCLCTTTSNPYQSDKWKRYVKYHFLGNSTQTMHGTREVSTKKSTEFDVYDDVVQAPHYTMTSYNVWVYTAYYEKKQTIPYDCIFFYEACTNDKKIWVYEDCPKSEHCLE